MSKTATCFLIAAACMTFVGDTVSSQEIKTYFSPEGGISTAIAEVIDKSEKSIDAAIYSISDERITHSLAQAAARGVAVRLLVDRTQTSGFYSTAPDLARTPVVVRTDTREQLQHNKYLIADSKITITGSANWTKSANARNAENIVIITHEKTAADFSADFAKHWDHSVPFRRSYKSRQDDHRTTPVPFNPKTSPTPREF